MKKYIIFCLCILFLFILLFIKFNEKYKNYEYTNTIYVINLGSNCKIQEYTIVNRDIQYNNRRCILLKAVGTKQ